MGLFSKQSDPQVLGKKISDFIVWLTGYDDTNDFIKKMEFNNVEADRFRFCLLFLGVSYAIFWVNWSQNPNCRNILDFMLECTSDVLKRKEDRIRVGDYILDKNESKLFYLDANENTRTDYYSIFINLYEKRVSQFTDAIVEQLKDSKNRNFPSSPVGKLLVRNFTGEDFSNHVKLYYLISTFLLVTYSPTISEGIVDILKGRL